MLLGVWGWVFTGLLLVLVVTCIAVAVRIRSHFFGVRADFCLCGAMPPAGRHAAGVVPAGIAFAFACVIGLAAPVADWGSTAMAGGVVWVFVRAWNAANAI